MLQRPLKRANKTKIILDASRDTEDKNMSMDQMSISKTDNDDRPSEKLTDETDENRTYQSRIENLGAVMNED